MKVKGTAVKSIQDFVRKNHPDQYETWFNKLPEKSKEIHRKAIFATDWYEIEYSIVKPTEVTSELFFSKDFNKAAYSGGFFSAETALSGIYKIFVRVSSPKFIISRAERIFSSYYSGAKFSVTEKPNGVRVNIKPENKIHPIIEYRIAGWIQKAFEITGCKNVVSKITESPSNGNESTTIEANWT